MAGLPPFEAAPAAVAASASGVAAAGEPAFMDSVTTLSVLLMSEYSRDEGMEIC